MTKVSQREALKPRREPYWQRLRPGCFVGFRPSARGGAGTWIARAYDEETRSYRLKALGDFPSVQSKDQFQAAKREAEAFASTVESGGTATLKIETVEDACRDYAKGRLEADSRFKRYVYGDPVAKLKLAKLRRHQLIAWRDRLSVQPALVARRKDGTEITRPRAPSSVNRDLVPLRAALRKVLALGAPGTDAAWQEALRPIRNADRQRTLRLSRDERRQLLEQLPVDAAAFVRALCLVPLRPGAVAMLSAGDFDRRSRELTIGVDKSGKPRRILLPANAAAHFAECSKGKLPGAPLFGRDSGDRWNRDTWKRPIAEAVAAASLPSGTTAYTLRHSVISELVEAGLPLLAIAQISGTSVEMIERHYGHLNAKAAAAALARLAL